MLRNLRDMTEQARIADRYRLERRIGAGSMGVVWRARDELLGRPVAMKELLLAPEPTGGEPDGRGPEDARARILREGRLAARLQHPHTISVFDIVLHEDRPWLVMEYLPSVSLARRLADGGPLPPEETARIGEQIADGLAAAHAAGIVHRDVKPGNVLIAEDGTVKLTDFGVSWAADDVALTRTGLIQGTPAFLAPEVARGQPPTPASDVFALGATLYTAVEGEPPFGLSDNTLAQLHVVAAGKVRPPSDAGALTALLMRLLRAEPTERPTAREAQLALAKVAAGAAGPAEPGVVAAGLVAGPAVGHGAARAVTGGSPHPTLVDVPPQHELDPDPADEPDLLEPVDRPRQIRVGFIAALLTLLVLAGAGTLVAMAASNTVQPAPTAPPPAAAPPSTTVSAAPKAEDLTDFVSRYYDLLPNDVEQAYALLGPEAQRKSRGFDSYRAFYRQYDEVSIVEGPRLVGRDVVQATIRFEDKAGRSNDEPHQFVVRADADGELKMVDFRRV
jgi:hypothetical protein